MFESEERVGGRMSAERWDGHVLDLAATATSHKYAANGARPYSVARVGASGRVMLLLRTLVAPVEWR